jgi:hypothetical protein
MFNKIGYLFLAIYPFYDLLIFFCISSFQKGVLFACIVFEDDEIKSRAERYLSSITNSVETVLRQNVKVIIGLASDSSNTGLASRSEPSTSFSRGNPNTSDGSSQKRLENAWLRAGMSIQPKPEKNQVLPQNIGAQLVAQCDEQISCEIKALKIGEDIVIEQGDNVFFMSPSPLHSKNGTRSAVARHRAAQHGVRSITLRFVLTRISKH